MCFSFLRVSVLQGQSLPQQLICISLYMSSYIQNQVNAHLFIQNNDNGLWINSIPHLNWLPKIIGHVGKHFLALTKISNKTGSVRLILQLLNQNGSYLTIPIQYKNLFQQLPPHSKKIAYILQSCIDYFLLHIQLTLTQFVSNSNFFQLFQQQVTQDLSNLLKLFQSVGLIKTKTKLSYKILKNELKLKKKIIKHQYNIAQINRTEDLDITKEEEVNGLQIQSMIKQIKYSSQKYLQVQSPKKGAFFSVEHRKCEITHLDGSKVTKNLAVKKARKNHNQQRIIQKIQKQLNIIKQIKSSKYTLKYYITQQKKTCLYMDYVRDNLKQLTYRGKLTIKDIFSLSHQLIEAIELLHSFGVVHRDLKPQNILVENKNGMWEVKIIDFGESALFSDSYVPQHTLGSSVPYSPIECVIDSEEGFNKPEIDYWSVFVIIYELTFHRLPFYFNRHIQSDIVGQWKEEGEFDPCLNLRARKGLKIMQETICFLSVRGLKIKPKERLRLQQAKAMIRNLQGFYNELISLTSTAL